VALLALVASGPTGPRAATAGYTVLDSTSTVLWTAPGDDGLAGRAARYQLRYRTVAIAGTDTLSWWNAATAVAGLPTPGIAGATDSVTVTGLDPTATYYFIVIAADEVPNWSGYSNVAIRPPVTDTRPPAAVADLGVVAP
jgi:hypothetical protein